MDRVSIIMVCAETAHEVNRQYCLGMGDRSQGAWQRAPEWQRASALEGARFVLDNPGASEAASHNSWLAQKFCAGWVYGEVKDAGRKTHPCIVPYEHLPVEQQMKDRLFKAVVLGVAARWEKESNER